MLSPDIDVNDPCQPLRQWMPAYGTAMCAIATGACVDLDDQLSDANIETQPRATTSRVRQPPRGARPSVKIVT